MDRAEYRRILLEVDRILLEDWDPLDVREEPDAYDEYTNYAPLVIRRLMDGCSQEQICELLAHIELDWMGLQGSAERRSIAAKKLLAVRLE
ncbi:MAG: hypothetical protein HZC36_06920 [Armatimonadetes bacterium]|nr:hypothetical protein [Armatimonadota bacterium]